MIITQPKSDLTRDLVVLLAQCLHVKGFSDHPFPPFNIKNNQTVYKDMKTSNSYIKFTRREETKVQLPSDRV